MLDEYIEEFIEKKLAAAVAKLKEPIIMLKDFADKELVDVDDMCRIFNRTDLKAGREWIREAAKRADLPRFKVGRNAFFHKKRIVALFLGEWKPECKQQPERGTNKTFEEMAERLAED